jgi:transposase
MPRTCGVCAVTTIGIDMDKNTLHMVGLDSLGAIVLARAGLARAHHVKACEPLTLPNWHRSGDGNTLCARELAGAWPRREAGSTGMCEAFSAGAQDYFRDAHAMVEAVLRSTTRFVPAKINEQLDLQALHRVRSRLVSERTAVINQLRGFLLERGIIVRQRQHFLRHLLPDVLAKRTDVDSCRRVMIVPGIGPLISSAMVAAMGNRTAFAKGRDQLAHMAFEAETRMRSSARISMMARNTNDPFKGRIQKRKTH